MLGIVSSKMSEVCASSFLYTPIDVSNGYLGAFQYHVNMFAESTNEAYEHEPRYQFLRVNLQQNPLRSFLVSLFTNKIRQTIPEEQWERYLVSNQNVEYGIHFHVTFCKR